MIGMGAAPSEKATKQVDAQGAALSAARRLLVIGMGNPDRGDDAAGLLVARCLAGRLPPWVRLIERGADALGLIDDWAGYDWVILVDAAVSGARPGCIHRIDGIGEALPTDCILASTHSMGVAEAIALARALDQLPPKLTIYAVEAMCLDSGSSLTPAVATAVSLVTEQIVAELYQNAGWEKIDA